MTTHVDEEITSRPDCRCRAAETAARDGGLLPARGERVAVVGCGTPRRSGVHRRPVRR
ncbi:hypothetical protein [Streptomyces sp. NPDC094049]|uniref:hypothetical protein n=1 Tax=Streptomyces sp. NPDC094049 TaxID=3154987 RepID=UPI003323FF64